MIVETRYYAIMHYRRGLTSESKPFTTYERAVAAGEYELEHSVKVLGHADYFTVEKRFEPKRDQR